MQLPSAMSTRNNFCSLPLKEGHVLKVEEAKTTGFVQQKNQILDLRRCLVSPLMAALVTLSPLCIPEASLGRMMDAQRGATLFRKACIGCHDGGGNIIQPGATLFLNDLQRNGIETDKELYRITYYGKGRMPGFGENCTPRGQCTFGARLQDEEIKLLAEFVKLQAERGWPSIDYGD